MTVYPGHILLQISTTKLVFQNFIFHLISFNAFWKFLRLGNSAWDFFSVFFFVGGGGGNFWSRDFFGFWFLPPIDHPSQLKSLNEHLYRIHASLKRHLHFIKWTTPQNEHKRHLKVSSELARQTSPVVKRIPLLIRSAKPSQSIRKLHNAWQRWVFSKKGCWPALILNIKCPQVQFISQDILKGQHPRGLLVKN